QLSRGRTRHGAERGRRPGRRAADLGGQPQLVRQRRGPLHAAVPTRAGGSAVALSDGLPDPGGRSDRPALPHDCAAFAARLLIRRDLTMITRRIPVLAALVALAGAALGAPALAAETQVAVAANFTEPAREIAAAFTAATGHKAVLSFGSSGQ